MGFLGEVGAILVSTYHDFMSILPQWLQDFINLFFISLIVVVYAIIIWNFYRFMARKNLISLNLKKYNRSEHPAVAKTLAALFYFLEYIIILPFFVFLWYGVFATFLILLTDGIEIRVLMMISATLIAATRMTAYYKEDLSKDIAKLIPFALLGAAITQVNAFSIDKVIGQLFAIPSMMGEIVSYMFFIFTIELILRFIETAFVATGIEDPVQLAELKE
jgi:hypothetical protein